MGAILENRYRITMSWNFDKEEHWINELSAQGLHFKQAGIYKSTFVRDDSARYHYSLDYQPGLQNNGKRQEYIDLYQDAGWEYVSSYGGAWHYFRREWKPNENPQLYTDWESLAAHYKRIQRVMGWMLIANIIILIGNITNLLARFSDRLWGIIVPVSAIYLLLFVLLGYGYIKMGKKIEKIAK